MFLKFRTDRSEQTEEQSDQGRTDRSEQTEEQSDQGLHCLLFRLHFLDTLLYGKATLFLVLGWLQQFFGVSEFLGVLRYVTL